MNRILERLRTDLVRRGYSEKAITQVLKWYQPIRQVGKKKAFQEKNADSTVSEKAVNHQTDAFPLNVSPHSLFYL